MWAQIKGPSQATKQIKVDSFLNKQDKYIIVNEHATKLGLVSTFPQRLFAQTAFEFLDQATAAAQWEAKRAAGTAMKARCSALTKGFSNFDTKTEHLRSPVTCEKFVGAMCSVQQATGHVAEFASECKLTKGILSRSGGLETLASAARQNARETHQVHWQAAAQRHKWHKSVQSEACPEKVPLDRRKAASVCTGIP